MLKNRYCTFIYAFFLAICACDNALHSSNDFSSLPPSELCEMDAEGEFQKGTGSLVDPYIVCTASQFEKLRTSQMFWGSAFELGQDIDLSTLGSVSPIGSYDVSSPGAAVPFTGQFDGKGYTLSNFSTEAGSNTQASGLFAYTSGATFSNLNLRNFDVRGTVRTGALIGFALNTNINNIRIEATTVHPRQASVAANDIGGMVGLYHISQAGVPFEIKTIYLDLSVQGNDVVGALLGQCTSIIAGGQLVIEDVTSVSTFVHTSSGNTIGGVIGYAPFSLSNIQATFRNIHHSGDVIINQGGGSWSGGIFGQIHLNGAGSSLVLEDISHSGQLSSIGNFNVNGYVGHIVGNFSISGANSTYNISRVSSEGNLAILANAVGTNSCYGGLFGAVTINNNPTSTLNISDSYFQGQISTVNTNNLNGVGGIVGCFWGGGASSAVVNFSNVYSRPTTSYGTATVSNSLAISGRHNAVVNASFTNSYFNAPATMIGAGGRGEPTNSAGVTSLNSVQINQQASFTGFNFSTIWQIIEGFDSPFLR